MIFIEHTGRAPLWSTWLRTAIIGAAGLIFLVFGFFFLAVAVLTAAVVATVIGVRWWWLMRRMRQRSDGPSVLEGEYQVIERRKARPDDE